MADEIDPHILVLLMNYQYGGKRQDGAPRRADTEGYVLDHGIGDDYNTNLQTFKILDALANLSVRKSKTQVVALAMQVDSAKQGITFTVAENKKVQDGIDLYLKKIWEGLQELSDFYENSLPEELDNEVSLDLKMNIYRTVFEHTLPKQLGRVQIYLNPLVEFTKEVFEYDLGEANLGFEEDLSLLVSGLCTIADFLQELRNGKNPTAQEWREILSIAMLVSNEAVIVLEGGDHSGCETLAANLNKSKGMSILPPPSSYCKNSHDRIAHGSIIQVFIASFYFSH